MASNIRLLDGMATFVEVVRSGSFTGAAQSTGHSTSYISKEISRLEERLAVRLLNRSTRSLSLTPEGQLYFQQCEQIVQDAQQAENAVTGNQSEPSGMLRVSCPVSFGLSRIRPLVSAFMEKYPKVCLELDLSDRKVDLVNEGFDVVIRASEQLKDSSLISRRILRSRGVTVASPEYLRQYGMPISPAELVDHQILNYSYVRSPLTWVYHSGESGEVSVTVKSRVMTNSPELQLALCKTHQGIMRMPLFNLGNELQTGELVELFADYDTPPIDVFLVYPSRKHMSAKLRCFNEFLLSALES